ncbi:glycosyltransferase family 2 protein [Macrococcus brunensis]|uniref:Glycosyltransferase family 2 protein n=1 Tax=Macrococcus brunensis TaxID=198483 RepID=A0A4R6BF52_9STAP|nr:glycosyltransferase family 2 protein [Macrococcus brunensis]TDL98399.1 glycosyltransferase family 2 protein [Macrococcus brunensis]
MIIAGILVLVTMCAGSFVFYRKPYIKGQQTEIGSVTVIIPARNEAHNLPHLLTSLQQQNIPYECLVIDDGSTDETAAIARQFGATVLTPPKREDWQGKSAACYFGAEHAKSDHLLFLDADVTLDHPQALKNLLTCYNGGLMTVQPYHITRKPYEQLSVWFNLLTVVGQNIFAAVTSNAAAAFGPVVLTSRECYFETGGHYEARDQLIEGFGLATQFTQHHLPVTGLLGRDTISFRMYHSLRAMTKGWAKHFASGAAATQPWIMMLIMTWMLGSVLSLSLLIFSHDTFCLMIYLLYSLHFYILSRRVGRFSLPTALLAGIAFLYFLYVFTKSFIHTFILKKVEWKGRNLKL